MSIATDVMNKIQNTYWLPESKDMVYGIFAYTTSVWPNNNFVYQIVVRAFTPGYSYLSDMYDQIGGIDVNGLIHYGPGFIGKLNNDNTIEWISGKYSTWNKYNQSLPTPTADRYSQDYIRKVNDAETAYLKDKYNRTYNSYFNQINGIN
jgi:hypothetical protein